MKNLIEYKYYFFMDIWYITGIFYFTILFILLGLNIIIDIASGSYDMFFQFYNFYNEEGALYMIFRFFLDLLLLDFYLIFSNF